MSKTGILGTPRKFSHFAVTMKSIDEPPYLSVGTDVSAKYRGAFCEAKIKSTKRLIKVKATCRQDSTTLEVQDEHIKGPLKVGAVVEIKCPDGSYQEAVINKLTDASWYTVVFDDGDEKTLRRSSLCLKGERHFAESETLDQLPLTNPEHFGTPVIGKKTNRGRRSNHVPEEESSSSSSDEEEDENKSCDELLGKVVCVDACGVDKKKGTWFPALVVSPDCSDDIAVKKDFILIRSFKDGKFTSVPRKDVHDISDISTKNDNVLKQALDQALEFSRTKIIPSNWKMELKEESSSSEAEDEEEENKDDEEDSNSEDEEEIEPNPGENENFLQQLYKFMEDRGTPINKRPVLGYRNLNLFKLFRLVHKLGGFSNIESGAVWKQVYKDLGIPVLNSAAGYNVKCAYKKYLYGFEEYCTSASISFHMELPVKVPKKICKEDDQENKVLIKQESESQGKNVTDEFVFNKEPNDEELKLNETQQSTVKEITNAESCNAFEEKETEEKAVDNKQETMFAIEIPPQIKEEDTADDGLEKSVDEFIKDEEREEFQEAMNEDNEEVDGLERFPPGGKVRYDEWIKTDQIARPADKSVPKIKHRKKIKTKMDPDKTKLENDENNPKPCRLFSRPLFQPCGLESESTLEENEIKIPLQGPPKSLEITSILNGLQAAESSEDESEIDQHYNNIDNEDNEFDMSHAINELIARQEEKEELGMDENHVIVNVLKTDLAPRSPVVLKEVAESSDEQESELESTRPKKDFKKDLLDKPVKVKRGKRKFTDCGKNVSPSRKDEHTKCKDSALRLDTGISSSDEEEKCKPKNALTRKYNGFEDKRKSLRMSGFYTSFTEGTEKRAKLLNHSEERLRTKDRKDVWSSIQGQWPKKTLKELFSDSDTEGAASPPPIKLEDSPCDVSVQPIKEEIQILPSESLKPVADIELKSVEEKTIETGEKKMDFPSSGSNSVLNTPPTTPESPPCLSECRRPQTTVDCLETLEQNHEESMKSETDSTIEVDSVAGELHDLQFEGNLSPTGFDASISSSSSNQPEAESKEKGQKRLTDDQGGSVGNGSTKKLKRSHKSSVMQKKSKMTNTSDSEELSGGESLLKMQTTKCVSGLKSQHTKVAARTHSPGKYVKNRDRESFQKEYIDRLPKVYKWSFQMSDLENMTSMERIAFLQEKLQELRKHYLSLKSEVASIDRRRKRFKKKERESAVVLSTSSSPSSSSITAAVMLTLADPSLANSSQNAMPVECR
ncbi:AT-rich interactive domain-containing protein 4B isoform X2 [Bombina bombina]|uniref:AT-rich interactive domain-containing protein 4B isoform X2 n=1 Tax=Bombina bombina TaxID=8345 RepID=UPI00235A721B|nr:AT-rich interactive domain-containing protein 4B isoform X2 [Bombina bombina]